MSFMGGAECSTSGNPLSQFAKHTQDDNSLQRDRLRNGTPQGGMGGFRSAQQHGPQDEVSLFRDSVPSSVMEEKQVLVADQESRP